MQNVIYAATTYGYAVQVLDGSEVSFEYSAGNHRLDSQATTVLGSPNAVRLRQLRRWARQTAGEIAKAQGIPVKQVEYDADLESTLKEWDACR
jgi:hypothetical protein